jgi:D-arabinono-1,4-lactone oxidase
MLNRRQFILGTATALTGAASGGCGPSVACRVRGDPHEKICTTQQSNWSGTITYTPKGTCEPANLHELKTFLKQVLPAKIRPRGTGHSWNCAIVTDGYSVNTNGLTPTNEGKCICNGDQKPCGRSSCMTVTWKMVREPGRKDYCLLSVPAGINQGDFSKLAQDLGCPLPTQGPAPDITLSGFTANGCHGTGWDQPTIAELVYGIELQDAHGETLYFDETTMPESLGRLNISPQEMMNVVRVHMGALGVLSRIVLKLPMDAFNLRMKSLFVPVTEFLDRDNPSKLKDLLTKHDYVELFWFPYNSLIWDWEGDRPALAGPLKDKLWVIIFDRTPEKPDADEECVNCWNNFMGWFARGGNYIGHIIEWEKHSAPLWTWVAVKTMQLKNVFNDRVFKPRDAFLYQKDYFRKFLDLEFTIPMSGDAGFTNVVNAFYDLVDRMEKWRKGTGAPYPVNLNVHARFVKNSQALLSPAYAPEGSPTHTCYIEYLSYSHGSLTDDYNDFNQEFYSAEHKDGWKKYGGLPNWGKDLPSVPGIYSYVHGILNASSDGQPSRLQRFLQVRDCIDPGGATFTNDYLGAFFSGQGVSACQGAEAVRSQALPPLPPRETRTFTPSPFRLQHLPQLDSPGTEPLLAPGKGGRGYVELGHDPTSGIACLTNEHDEPNLLAFKRDEKSGVIEYRTVTPSQYLTPGQILDRVALFYPR